VREEKKHQHPRPATLSRRTTPQYVRAVGSARPREKDHLEDSGPRDSGESFPQFWYVFAFFLPFPFRFPGPAPWVGVPKRGESRNTPIGRVTVWGAGAYVSLGMKLTSHLLA
jgi:hypothetical protein